MQATLLSHLKVIHIFTDILVASVLKYGNWGASDQLGHPTPTTYPSSRMEKFWLAKMPLMRRWKKTNAKETVAGTLRGGWKKGSENVSTGLLSVRHGAVGGKQCLVGIPTTPDFPNVAGVEGVIHR